jgi:hypothetical protein
MDQHVELLQAQPGRGQVAAEPAGDQGGRPLQLPPGGELVLGQGWHPAILLRARENICE